MYNATKYFFILPLLDHLKDFYTRFPLLPDGIENFDVFGNLIGDSRDILRREYYSQKMQNYTETFKEMYQHLYVERDTISEDGWDDPKGIFQFPSNTNFALMEYKSPSKRIFDEVFTGEEIEESAEYWESHGHANHPVKTMPKTFTTFPRLNVPKSSRYARVLEMYLIDLCRLFYPFIESADLTSLEDLLALFLFHLYIHLNDDNRLYRAYVAGIIKDLRRMEVSLNLPSSSDYLNRLNRLDCLHMLFEDVLKFGCFHAFQIMLQSKTLSTLSSVVFKRVLSCEKDKLVRYFIRIVDRNIEIVDIGPNYTGNLCHAVYWSDKDWLMMELLSYDDVDWNAFDSHGYTVLGYMIHNQTLDERYKLFLKHTENFISCFKSASQERNILEECFILKDYDGDRHGRRGLSKFFTYLKERNQDDFSSLLACSAVNNRPGYFDRILDQRSLNCCHELDAAFQSIYHHLKRERRLYLQEYLVKIMMKVSMWHGMKGRLEQIFFMKWEIQMAKWRVAVDEMGNDQLEMN